MKEKNLTDYQKNFILKEFFRNYDFPGWEVVATALIEKGSCIVAGTSPLWSKYSFSIGAFIKTKIAENTFNCLFYEFDLEGFLNSEIFNKRRTSYELSLRNKVDEITKEINEMNLNFKI